nr:PepSY domain-containing protein [Gordonia insulae]
MTQDPPVPSTPSSSPGVDHPPPRAAGGGRLLVRRLHFYAGILVAPFLLIAAVSGALYAVAPTLENIVYSSYLHTDSRGTVKPLAEQVSAAAQSRPDLTVSAVRPSVNDGDTTRVLFDDPGLGESERLAVFVDPVTARPVGELVSYGSSGALPLRTWISSLHRNLHLGEPGRLYSELAASWLWVIALGGLILWVSRYRRGNGRTRLLTIDRSSRGRNRTLNWHGAMGIWIVVGLVFLSATGLTWSRYAGENVSEVRSALQWTTPTLDTTLPGAAVAAPGSVGHEGHDGHTSSPTVVDPAGTDASITRLDDVLAAARAAGIDGKVEVAIPESSDAAFTVTQTREAWQFSPNSVAVDGATDANVDESWFADWPLAAKLTTWGIALHMGVLFGLVSQIALFVLAVVLVAIIIRGYQMWWQRRPRRGGAPVGSPPRRGGLRQLPIPAIVGVLVVAVAVGWFIPLLGLSLAAFVLVDVLIGAGKALQRRQT